jgi:hypothetical protein
MQTEIQDASGTPRKARQPMPDMPDTTYAPPAVARRYAVNVRRVHAWIATGELAAVNVGDGAKRPRWRVTAEAIADFERRRSAQPKAATTRRKRKKPEYTEYF